jgi:hypothetical protein
MFAFDKERIRMDNQQKKVCGKFFQNIIQEKK